LRASLYLSELRHPWIASRLSKSINGDARAWRRSLKYNDILSAGHEMAARRLYRGLDNGNVFLLVCIQITDADLGHEVSGRSACRVKALNGGGANPNAAPYFEDLLSDTGK
jgi:hypothetical protein